MRGLLILYAAAIGMPSLALGQARLPKPKQDSVARADSIARADSLALVRTLEKELGQSSSDSGASTVVAPRASGGYMNIGFVALSLVIAGPMKDQGRWWLVPSEDHPIIEQGGVIMSWAQDPSAARAFRDFLMSPEGTRIMNKHGFSPKVP